MIPLFAISDAVWLAVIGVIAMAVKEYFDRERARVVAMEVKKVETTLGVTTTITERKLDEMAKVGEKTHDLCNSAMGEQKRLYAVKCRAAANDKPTAENMAEADLAEQMYKEHQIKQAKVDRKNPNPPPPGTGSIADRIDAVPAKVVDEMERREGNT